MQTDITTDSLPRLGKESWQPLFLSRDTKTQDFGLWCALLDDRAAERALGSDSWDLSVGDGRPGFSQSWSTGSKVTTYHRFGSDDGTRPLVLYRQFHGSYPEYCEIDEEFRLYHDLAEDKQTGRLLSFDSSGREIEVVKVEPKVVRARLKCLRQFQAATRLHLAFYIDSVRYSARTLDEVPEPERHRDVRGENFRWGRDVGEGEPNDAYTIFSRVLGKLILSPPPLEKAGIWPFDREDDAREVAFIIGVDENGEPVEHSSSPDSLSNYFGANPGAPHYLTPVYFRREVMSEYFAEPERYTASDGRLSCLGLWGCQIDNNHPTHIVVFLGDLGRNLPYEERLHWRQFNVPPEGGVSETNFRRSFLAQRTEAQAADLTFRHEYSRFRRDWKTVMGWNMYLDPSPADSHLLGSVRIPVTNSQSELDGQVLTLAKLLVDSLNEKEIEKQCSKARPGAKGISKLQCFFEESGYAEGDSVIQFLRDLQSLRSTGSGHRKGAAYNEMLTKLGLNVERKPDAFARLLEEATAALGVLRMHYL